AVLTLVLNSGIPPGAAAIGATDEPLFEGFKTIFGDGIGARLLALIAVTGLAASFHSIIFAYGRQIYSLSRAGYVPRVLSLTHATRKTPHVALITGAVVGWVVAFIIRQAGAEHPVVAVLLNMAVFGAVIAYALQMASFLLLRRRRPELARPYRSPLGTFGAWAALLISLVCLGALLVDPVYQKVLFATVVWYALGLLYFALYARHRLVYAPEEAVAEGRESNGSGAPR
ncbi:MAG: amino acid permease, partial [Myxococcota bacterium]